MSQKPMTFRPSKEIKEAIIKEAIKKERSYSYIIEKCCKKILLNETTNVQEVR